MRGLPGRGWLCALVICGAGCGDNSKQCGDGTNDRDGDNICTPDEGDQLVCGNGTRLDMLTDECVPDETLCGSGTVLINGECQDPTAGLVVDLEEGPEPNGFEDGATPAGTITLKPEGGPGVVIHGCITPVDNSGPDLDVYELVVTEPTLLEITADGVEGLAAGFIAFGDSTDFPSLSNWFRLGLDLTSDTSKRQLLLPVAGTYQIVMTDSRTLLPITQGGPGFPPAGNPDGTSCYYTTIKHVGIPTTTPLDLVNGNSGTIGDDLGFFSANFPTGFTSLTAVIDPEDANNPDSRAASSLILINNGELRQINDAGNGFPADTPVSNMVFGGIQAGDLPIVVLDYVWNMTPFPADFQIDANAVTSSQALATDGSAVDATSNGQDFFDGNGDPQFDHANLFHWDVTDAGEIDGMDVAFSIPVQGVVVDQDGVVAAPFTGLSTSPAIDTFASYKGLLRTRAPGRYYFMVFAPRDPVSTAFTVTSTIAAQTPDAFSLDTPSADTAIGAFGTNVLTYDAGSEPWQLLDATGTNTGNVDVALFDPAAAFGRLDPVQTKLGNSAPVSTSPDATPLVSASFVADGSTPIGRIFRNPTALQPPAVTQPLVKVVPAAPGASPSFVLDFATRIYEDFGGPAIAAGDTKNDTGTITAGSEERYYFETTPGNVVTITVTPTTGPTLDAAFALLGIDEAETTVVDNASGTGAESITFTQDASGFTAFEVRGATGASIGDYDVTVQVVAGS